MPLRLTQYLRPISRHLTTRTIIGIFTTCLAISLGLAAPALASPSGDEYLPKVPKAAGKGVVANPEQGAGASVVAPPVRGSETAEPQQDKPKNDVPKNDKSTGSKAEPGVPIQPAADNSSGGGNTLLSPVILLMIAGVLCVAAAMILRRRRVRSPQQQANRPRDEQPRNARPTPDGEIVADRDKVA
jgi:hypothetical protein